MVPVLSCLSHLPRFLLIFKWWMANLENKQFLCLPSAHFLNYLWLPLTQWLLFSWCSEEPRTGPVTRASCSGSIRRDLSLPCFVASCLTRKLRVWEGRAHERRGCTCGRVDGTKCSGMRTSHLESWLCYRLLGQAKENMKSNMKDVLQETPSCFPFPDFQKPIWIWAWSRSILGRLRR